MNIDTELFRVLDDAELDLKDTPTVIKPFYRSKKDYRNILDEDTIELRDQQSVLNASGQYSLLIIFQAMDAAGKDGAIKHVMSGVNPQGCHVHSFKAPTEADSNTIFYGGVSSNCLNGERSEFSTVRTMKTYWLFVFILKFWQNRNFLT